MILSLLVHFSKATQPFLPFFGIFNMFSKLVVAFDEHQITLLFWFLTGLI